MNEIKSKLQRTIWIGLLQLIIGANIYAQEHVVFDQNATTDVITYLMAANTQRGNNTSFSGVSTNAKHGWLEINNSSTEAIVWEVQLNSAATYEVTALLDLNANTTDNFTMSVVGSSNSSSSLTFSASGNDWQRVSAGQIFLPAGTYTISFNRNTLNAGNIHVKSLELIDVNKKNAYDQRVGDFKGDIARFGKHRYGIMQQYGTWGYPQSGPRKDMETWANEFDVESWIADMKMLGADYVVWSITWWTYQIPAPISAVDNIVGNSERTSERDLLGEVADALEREGIDLYFYYHTGQDTHLGYQSTDWWQANNFPDSFSQRAIGDRSTFFDNWVNTLTEIGNRYGDRLDGWFFDDGLVYYPAPFERLGAAAKAGNADRLISYNPWIVANYTDFEDLYFGEHHRLPNAGDNGFFTGEGQDGLFGHNMYRLENNWGVRAQNQGISALNYNSASGLYDIVKQSNDLGFPSTFNLMMYEDGTLFQQSVDAVLGMKALLDAEEDTNSFFGINDDDSRIIKTGNWISSSNRNHNDYLRDVSYTKTNGDYFDYTFTGTSIQILGPTNSSHGNVEVFLDGVSQGITSTNSSTYNALEIIFEAANLSSGIHTVRMVKRSGAFMVLDAIGLENLALNQPASQSSTRQDAVASRANDGNTNGNFSSNSVSHTSETATNTQDWWQVDLGIASSIEAVQVWNRTDCCQARLANFNIFISETPFTSNNVADLRADATIEEYSFTGTAGSPTLITTEGATGRYVRLQLNSGVDPLTLAELKVFGARFGNNLSVNKSASQSSTGFGGVASRANDNNTNGDYHGGQSVSHTAIENNVQDWWQVDLGGNAVIEGIRIFNRTDAAEHRLSDFNIFISEVPFTSNSVSATANQSGVTQLSFSGQAGHPTDIDSEGVLGRYVRLQLNSFSDPINLAELTVFGEFINSASSAKTTRELLNEVPEETLESIEDAYIYPNPTSSEISIDLMSDIDKTTTFQIVNLFGQLVRQYEVNLLKGNNHIELGLDGLQEGLYILRNEGSFNKKFIVQGQ